MPLSRLLVLNDDGKVKRRTWSHDEHEKMIGNLLINVFLSEMGDKAIDIQYRSTYLVHYQWLEKCRHVFIFTSDSLYYL